MLWLLASDSVDGSIDADPKKLAFRLRMSSAEVVEALNPLIQNAFFVADQDASEVLAERTQSAVPETEAETEAIQRQRSAPRSQAIACPPEVDAQVWKDWQQLRKQKRAPVTQTVVDGAMSEASKAGMSLEAFLRIWCRRGSQGLEADWLKPHERQQQTGETAYQRSMRERVAEFAPGLAKPAPNSTPSPVVEIFDVASRRLG